MAIAVKRPNVFIPASLYSNIEGIVGVRSKGVRLRCQQPQYQPAKRLVGGGEVEWLSIMLDVLLTEEPFHGKTQCATVLRRKADVG